MALNHLLLPAHRAEAPENKDQNSKFEAGGICKLFQEMNQDNEKMKVKFRKSNPRGMLRRMEMDVEAENQPAD